MRLNKYLAITGIASRRKSDALIKEKKVTVNGRIIIEPWFDVSDQDSIVVSGKKLHKSKQKFYVLLNKPKGVVSTVSDEKNRKTVDDLISIPARLFPVGRLDYNTTGVLLCTNDGDLSYRLSHPKYHVDKVYSVEINRHINKSDIKKLENGIRLSPEEFVSVEVKLYRETGKKALLELVLKEGKNRQIHRMLEKLGYFVNSLDRKSFAGLTAHGLKKGDWRFLTSREIKNLYKNIGLKYGNT